MVIPGRRAPNACVTRETVLEYGIGNPHSEESSCAPTDAECVAIVKIEINHENCAMPRRISQTDRGHWRKLSRCDSSPKFLPHDGPRLMFEDDAWIQYPHSHCLATNRPKGTMPDSCQRALPQDKLGNRVVRNMPRSRLVSCLKHAFASVEARGLPAERSGDSLQASQRPGSVGAQSIRQASQILHV
jgi:hypothetical protein